MDEINKLIDDMTLDYEKNIKRKQQIDTDIEKSREINNKLHNIQCDNKKFVNPRGIDYKRHTQSSVQYTTQYPENTTRNSQTNSIQKDTLNSRIGEFHFNNPAINQNTYNPNQTEFPDIYHTKSKKADNQSITNNRLSEYNPISRAISTPVQYQLNNMPSNIHQNKQNNKEINSQRMTSYQPLSMAMPPTQSGQMKNTVPNKLPSNARL
jgi:hypothetical protein